MIVCGQCRGKKRVGALVCWVCKGHGFVGPLHPGKKMEEDKKEDKKDESSEPNADS